VLLRKMFSVWNEYLGFVNIMRRELHKEYPIAGLILHSAILSGLRILNINIKKHSFQRFFGQYRLNQFYSMPNFYNSWDEDEEVPIEHSKILFQKCHNPYEGWWPRKQDTTISILFNQRTKGIFLKMLSFHLLNKIFSGFYHDF